MEEEPEIVMPPDQLAGVWANRVDVHLTPHEFTIDFVRIDPEEAIGICVARVSFSPTVASQLLDKLEPLLREWGERDA